MYAAGFSADDEVKSHFLLKIQVEQAIKLVAFNLSPRSEKVFSDQQAHAHTHTHILILLFSLRLGCQDMNMY